jgi:hypothetical protein
MKDRPEHVRCIQREHSHHLDKTWCERTLSGMEWVFTDPGHAAENGLQNGRLVACSDCVKAIHAALQNGSS